VYYKTASEPKFNEHAKGNKVLPVGK
jgi:hypothetical protein